MPIVNTTEMFKKAYEGGYAIGAFNVNNMEIVQGITEAAKAVNAPVILQVSKGARAYANHTYLVKLVEAAVQTTGLPIALHLDHGPDFETCKACIDGGFTSVMIDGSHLPFEKNIEETRKVVEYAHKYGVTVEDIRGKRRTREIAQARHVCIYIMRTVTDLSLPSIGRVFNRDHSTILSSIDTIQAKIREDASLENDIDDLIKEITNQ